MIKILKKFIESKRKYDIITITYTKKGDAVYSTKTIQSRNYRYWYDHTFDTNEKGEVLNLKLKSLNIKIGDVIYKNIDSVSINGKKSHIGLGDGFVKVQVDL